MNRTLGALGALALATTFSLADRAEAEPGTHRAASAPEGDISVWAMGTEGDNLGVLADAFMEEFPDVSVEVTAVPWDAAHDRIVTAIAGGEVPDVSLIGTTWMGEFATLGGLDPTPDSIDPAQFFEGRLEHDRRRRRQLRRAVVRRDPPRLLPHRPRRGGRLQPGAGEVGRADPARPGDGRRRRRVRHQPAARRHRARGRRSCRSSGRPAARSSTRTTTSRSTREACVEALTFYDSFFEDGLAQPTVSDVPVEAQFADGTVGSFISGPWMIGIVTDAGADPETWTVAHQPTAGVRHVVRRRRQPRRVRAVRQQGRRPGRSSSTCRGPRCRSTWYETVSDLPSVQAAWDDEALAGDELLAAFGEQLDDAKAPPAIPTWEEVASAIDGQIEQVTVGDTSPEDGCAAMQEEAESIGTGL